MPRRNGAPSIRSAGNGSAGPFGDGVTAQVYADETDTSSLQGEGSDDGPNDRGKTQETFHGALPLDALIKDGKLRALAVG